jgi:hypothetical protein
MYGLILLAAITAAPDTLDLPGSTWHGWPVVSRGDGWARVRVPFRGPVAPHYETKRGAVRVVLTRPIRYRSRIARFQWIVEKETSPGVWRVVERRTAMPRPWRYRR